MLVYLDEISPRTTYTLDLVFRQWLGIEYKVTACKFQFEDSLESKFCYAEELVGGDLWIKPSGFLKRNDILHIDVAATGEGRDFVCFPQQAGLLPFDIFAAVFYMVSRYEEYLPFTPDVHGRFPSADSFTVKHGIYEIPIVDIWMARLAAEIKAIYPYLALRQTPIQPLVHIDVDNAFAHKGKGFVRTTGKIAAAIVHFQFKEATKIAAVALGFLQDSFNTYTQISNAVSAAKVEQMWYFHLGNLTKFDRPVSWKSRAIRAAMANVAEKGTVGIHPSYEAGLNLALLEEEVGRFVKIMGHRPEISRFHFLRFRFPESFRVLVAVGINHDYSIGFSDRVGYRAGTSRPFPFFDVQNNCAETLVLHPFVMMDSALNYQLRYTPALSVEKFSTLYSNQQNTGGEFGVVFHNEIVSGVAPWLGWDSYFYSIMQLKL
ncbi:DUF7033 domain-containing protein [Williamwhitmania taraxaci]|uniref:DUF7033 domain-containing protein n=1 Tax=Williamwhitmania taraxaci TaxID=1640674 RepID=A0A1G6K4V3_9BACT|nr:hypothetical protein [Williamwhitmania taraxaci]SDC26030.1 hypothetical protein SAMN05216323_102313 [Williamwhitmania taraxaci]